MPSANCFDAPTLKDYLLGRLSEEQSDVVAAHLEACLSCEATVSQLDRASDTLTNGLRLPAVAAEPQTDDELQNALNKVQSLEALADRPTSEVSVDRSPVLRDYRLLEPLGSGGMGQVFKAVHTRLDRLVAVKLLPARRLGDDQAVARFQREMRVIGQLSHPAIVQATDAGEVDGTHFLVMEYVEGCDLNTLVKVCRPLSIADACEITRQAAVGLEYAHQQGIVHRDIKPSNLMLSRTPNVSLKILDLGLALLSGVQAPVDELTTVGQLMGTLDYMAPEQLEDSHLVGPRADIYALAATLFRLLTGFSPFANENRKTPLQKLRALATQAAPPIRERRADLPLELAAIIDRALSRDPTNRFASMNEFAAALAPWCAGHDLTQLVGHVSNVSGPLAELPSLRHQSRSHVRQNVGESPNGPRSGERGYERKDAPIARSGHVENVPHGSPPRRTLLIALALLILAALGIVITIETNKGTLIVESLREGVEVRVKKSGRMVEEFELTTGPKSARLAAGEYEIEFVGEADGLQIQNGKFVLKRGDTVVAKVTEHPEQLTVVEKPKPEQDEPAIDLKPRKPIEIIDLAAKGMDTFEEANPDLIGARKVREALQKKINVEFVDQPLTECVAFLKQQSGLEVFIDDAALDEEGIPHDAPCTLFLKDVRIATVMKFLLEPLQCAWTIDQGQVRITTLAKEKEEMVTRWYPVGRMLPGVKQAVERMNAEAPDIQSIPQGGFGGGNSGGGFFRVDDHAERFGLTLPPLGPRRACPDGALTGQLPLTSAADCWLSVGLAPTEATTLSEKIIRSVGTSPTGAGSAANFFGSWPVSAPPGQARRWRDQTEIPIFSSTVEPLSDSHGIQPHHSQRSTNSPKDTELCMFGGVFNLSVADHFEALFTETLPHPWMNRDGEGGTFEFLQNVLVVRHTWRAQADIEALLRLIEAAFLKPLTEPIEIRPAGYATEADVATRKKLTQIVDADFQDLPLSEVAEWISLKLDLQVLFDKVALEEEGIGTDSPVTLHVKGISGELLLSRVLKPLQLDYQIEEGLLIVTTAAKVKERLLTKVYDIRDLLDRGLHPSQPLAAIESATPGPWLNVDGEGGSMQLFADTLLIIQQTPANHAEVAKFLAGLRFQLGDQPKVPRVIKTRPKTPLAVQPSQPTPNEPKPTPPAPTKPTADNQPRYEGKSFDEWLAVLDVERSPARLTDALEALRLLGDQSRLETVADRVLKVFRVVEIPQASFAADSSTAKLQATAQRWFQAIRVAVRQKRCADELRSGTLNSRRFILLQLHPPDDGLTNLSSELASAMLAATHDTDRQVREAALKWVLDVPLDEKATQSRTILEKRLREALQDKEGTVALLAAPWLIDSEPDTPAVVNAIRKVVDYQQDDFLSWANSYSRFEAVKLAAVMGPRAAPAAKVIARVLLEPGQDLAGYSGGSHHMGRGSGFVGAVPGFQAGSDLTFKQWAAVALARCGKAAAETLPTIKEALMKRSPGDISINDISIEDPTTLSKRDSFNLTLYELLIATQARLEEKPPLDLSNPVELKLTKEDLILSQSHWKLLRVEQELLKQKYGADADNATLRELDQKVKAAEEQFQALSKLYNEQRKKSPRTSSNSPSEPKVKPVDPPKDDSKTE